MAMTEADKRVGLYAQMAIEINARLVIPLRF